MRCLPDSIRHDDPAVQHLLRAVEDATSLTAWVLAAWQVARVGRQTTRTGQRGARLPQHRVVAVFGNSAARQRRLWLEARRQGIRRAPPTWSGTARAPRGYGSCLRRVSHARPPGFSPCTTRRTSGGRGRPPGWMGGPPTPGGGVPGPGTVCGMACRMVSWQTSRTPWTSRGCRRQPERLCAPCLPLRTVSPIFCPSGSLGSTDAWRRCSVWPWPRTRNYARRPGALDSRDGLLDIARSSRTALFDPCIDEDELLLSFMFWQLLQLRNDYFLKSYGIPSAVNAPNLLQAYHRTMETGYYEAQR